MQPGDQPGPEHVSRVVSSPWARDGLRVFRLAASDTEPARRELLTVGHRSAASLDASGPRWRTWEMGQRLAFTLGWPAPVAGLVHRDVPLYAHRDTQAPERCRNITLWLTHGCRGGDLVLADARLALRCEDGVVVGFDGQTRLHGITAFELDPGGYRIACTFYSPLPPAA